MKKVVVIIISFFMLSNTIYASELPVLDSLEILNGVNTLSFDKMNNLYTINVYEDVDSLDIKYSVNENIDVSIIGNELYNEVNDVYINLTLDNEENSYHLIVNKIDNTKNVLAPFYQESEEIKDNKLMQVGVIIIFIAINILMVFILFHKKNPKKDLFIK